MEKQFISIIFCILLISLFTGITGCGNDVPYYKPVIAIRGFVYKPVETAFLNSEAFATRKGLLVTRYTLADPNYVPVIGATIECDGISQQTDSNGQFVLNLFNQGIKNIIVNTSTSQNAQDYSPIVVKMAAADPNTASQPPDSMKVVPPNITVPNGKKHQFNLNFKQGNNDVDTPPGTITWSVEGGIGVVDSNGLFTATTPGQGKVIAVWDTLSSYSDVRVKGDSEDTGTLHGFVSSGTMMVPGVIIEVDGISEIGITDVNGEYTITEILPGNYNVTATLNNQTAGQEKINIKANKINECNFIITTPITPTASVTVKPNPTNTVSPNPTNTVSPNPTTAPVFYNISGKYQNSQGTPIPNVRLVLKKGHVSIGDKGVTLAFTDTADGFYSFSNITSRLSYTIDVFSPDDSSFGNIRAHIYLYVAPEETNKVVNITEGTYIYIRSNQ
ncbi:MAG: Ig-like domain-containing protein [Candidatus Eremiobacterota bacterium]